MSKSIESDISDTKGGKLIFDKSVFNEIGISAISPEGKIYSAVWWNNEDTDKVIEKIKEVV